MKGHAEIFEQLRREILAGRYDADKKLPSEAALAARFGCSRPTVSRVTLDLKREGLIVTRKGAATRISRFALNATGALGLVVPGEVYTEVFTPICERIARQAERSGWDVVRGEVWSADPVERAREVRQIAHRFSQEHVAGVFLQPLEFIRDSAAASAEVVSYFDRASIAVVLLDYDIVSPPARSRYDLVGIDNVSAGLAIGRSLLAAGAKSMAFLLRPDAAPTISDRLRGVACAVTESGGTWSFAENVLCCEPDDERAVAAFLAKRHPDAIVSGNDATAARLRRTLEHLGGAAARIRLAGFDDVSIAGELGLTTVRQPLDAIADVALQTLLSRIRQPQLPPRKIVLDAPLVERWKDGAAGDAGSPEEFN